MNQHEQHFLTSLAPYQHLLSSIDLTPFTILEFGIGHGEITQLILERNPKRVIGYELDPALSRISHQKLTVHEGDFTKHNFDFLKNGGPYGIISNPPYSTLGFIKNHIIVPYGIKDVIIMISPKYQEIFPDYQHLLTFDGSQFTPPSHSLHHVIGRGFHLPY